jgi:ATP-dependent DNA ligase
VNQSKRRERKNSQLAIPFESKRLYKWGAPYYVQPKLDGIRCRVIIDPEDLKLKLYSSTNKLITSVPHLTQQLQQILVNHDDVVELDGELYKHGMNFQDITSIVSRTVNLHSNHEVIDFHLFDCILTDRKAPQFHRTIKGVSEIYDTIKKDKWCYPNIKIVKTFLADDMDDIANILDNSLDAGYEGVIIRNKLAKYERKRSYNLMKLKPCREDKYYIVSCQEEISIHGEPKNSLGALICKGESEHQFKVGTGPLLTRAHRQELWARRRELKGRVVRVKYQELTKDRKIPRFPVAIELCSKNERSLDE